jgi:Ca2+-transporting ATPase
LHRVPQELAGLPEPLRRYLESLPPEAMTPYVAFVKGAIDGLLTITSGVWVDGRTEALDEAWITRIMAAHDRLAKNGMRILGIGLRALEQLPEQIDEHALERDFLLLGLIGMIDPPRPEVQDAIRLCKSAGIRIVMITGDHPLTARHIANELGITQNDRFLTGLELDKVDDAALQDIVRDVSVFARVSPEHKIRLVDAFQSQGYIAAMTGDGVNDAPALKKADIGIAMGITGTDVSKEAADMVLQDDNFATIVAAVEEGRVIFDNIRKVIQYLLSCNSGEIAVMFLGPLFGLPLPLLPLQILWMNLITDGLPALALAVEPAEKDVMRRPPQGKATGIFTRRMVTDIIFYGALMAAFSLGVGWLFYARGSAVWQTMIFTMITVTQLAAALDLRSDRTSIFKIGLRSNPQMTWALIASLILQLMVIYLPFAQAIFRTVALNPIELGICLLGAGLLIAILELEKLLTNSRRA